MNLWDRLRQKESGASAEAAADATPRSLVPRLDIALSAAAVVTRVILDPRLAFLAAVAVALFVPGRRGHAFTAVLVAIGAVLVYKAERWRRIPEHLRWLVWADLGRPLLQRLSQEAPGTYAHTIAVANLTEGACTAIGADGLLGRVGAYYHDIGKLRKPGHFVENQARGRNPHDKLKPGTSASIIRGHVRDGLELARDAGLPTALQAFITEHHGTMPISFFLAKARERDETVTPTDFAYPGPIPSSAETAICMLADGAEASVRALPNPTPDAIRAAVTALIERRISEGQLSAAPITLRQLAIVRDQFVRILSGMHHARVEYPTGAAPAAASEPASGGPEDRTLTLSPNSRASA